MRVVAELPDAARARTATARILDARPEHLGLGAPDRPRPRRRAPSRSATPRCSSRRGDLHTAALRSAKATDVYILDRDGEHVLEPVFTFHGFRYADVVGAEVVSADGDRDLERPRAARARFRSSHAALDQFHSNVFWSQRDNFVSVPTDCPQRDERLGWTGDAQAFSADRVAP